MKRLFFLTLLLPSLGGHAIETPHTKTQSVASTTQSTSHLPTSHLQRGAQYWGLNQVQWQRYQALMNNPLTYDMQDHTPLEVLTRFARDAQERDKLAEKLVEFEKARTESLLALDNAYQRAWKRLYPNLKPISHQPQRVVLFVRADCGEACFDALKTWRTKGASVDVYLVGQGQDAELQNWAAKAGVRHSDVNRQVITLNHDNRGLWFELAKGRPVPIAFSKQDNGQWLHVQP